MRNGRALDEPRLFVIGYGPSQSTVGANRAGRDAVRAILADPAPDSAGHARARAPSLHHEPALTPPG